MEDFTDDIDDYFAFPVAAGALRKMVQTLRMLHQSILELIPLIQWREEDEVFVSEHEKIRVLYVPSLARHCLTIVILSLPASLV